MDSVSWLHKFESTYRELGWLDAAHRFTDVDVAQAIDALEGRLDASQLGLGGSWLRDQAERQPDVYDLLASVAGCGVAPWFSKDYTQWEVLLPKLSAISRGAFPLDEVEITRTDEDDEGACDIVIACVVAGVRHQATFEVSKYGRLDELVVVLNGWIRSSGRRFVRLGEHFACVTDETYERL